MKYAQMEVIKWVGMTDSICSPNGQALKNTCFQHLNGKVSVRILYYSPFDNSLMETD